MERKNVRGRDMKKSETTVPIIPCNSQKPAVVATGTLFVAIRFFVATVNRVVAENPEIDYSELSNPELFLQERIFGEDLHHLDKNAQKFLQEKGSLIDTMRESEKTPLVLVQVLRLIIAYLIQTFKASKNGNSNKAWACAVDASRWAGWLEGKWDTNFPTTELHPRLKDELRKKLDNITKTTSERSRRAVNARHDKPKGSREKRAQIREIWASGKYESRNLCASQEYEALDMSYQVARAALRNTPTSNPWPGTPPKL
jgi:hypothetical protein